MQDEELSLDNILDVEDSENLFSEEETDAIPEEEEGTVLDEETEDEVTEVDPEKLFADTPEIVGDKVEDNKGDVDTSSTKEVHDSPDNNFYSNLATALKEEGILSSLDDDAVKKIQNPEDFAAAMEAQMSAGLAEKQRRIDSALNAGVDNSEIKQYEDTLSFLDSINEDALLDESDKGENLRKNLIYRDYLNRGWTDERARREVTKSLDAGTDVEDARDALEDNKEFFGQRYNALIDKASADRAAEDTERDNQAKALKKSILEDTNVFGELVVDKVTRGKIYDSISKPVYKDPDTGEALTEIQKYQRDNQTEFLKNLGLVYTLTDGFKNINGIVKGQVKKGVKKGLKELEHVINSTSRNLDGSIKYVSSANNDKESFYKGFDLDI